MRLQSRVQRMVLIEGRVTHVVPEASLSRKASNLTWEKTKVLNVAHMGGGVVGKLLSGAPD